MLGWDGEAGEVTDQAAGAVNLCRVDIVGDVVEVVAGAHGHNDLFEGGVAGPFADAVDGTFDLPGAGADGGDGVGDTEAEVVVAVHADHSLVYVGDVVEDTGDEVVELLWGGVADGVGNVDSTGTGIDDGFEDTVKVVPVGAGGVHGGEFDIAEVARCPADHFRGQLQDFLVVLLELVHEVDVGAGEEDVDTRVLGVADGVVAGVDGLVVGVGQPGDDGALDLLGNPGDGLKVAGGAEGESSLNDIDTQLVELVGDLYLLVDVQGGARGLFPVPEGRIEYHYFFHCEPPK